MDEFLSFGVASAMETLKNKGQRFILQWFHEGLNFLLQIVGFTIYRGLMKYSPAQVHQRGLYSKSNWLGSHLNSSNFSYKQLLLILVCYLKGAPLGMTYGDLFCFGE